MSTLHADFETRSTVDLTVAGLDTYSHHPDTDVWCLAYAFGDEPIEVWTPGDGFPERLRKHVESGGKLVGHNVGFELAVWNDVCVPRYGFPQLKLGQCACTQAEAYAMALPGSLERAAPAAGIEARKDAGGKRLMLQMCQPRSVSPDGKIVWWDEPDKVARLIEYCKQDVEVERQLHKRLVPLSPAEREVWLLDHEINNRGVQIDIATATAAQATVVAEQARLHDRLREVTGNFVGFTTEVARLTEWVRSQGVDLPGVAKADVLDALALDTLPAPVREALLIRQEAGRSSTAKLSKMLSAASADGRVRGLFQYHGASTGRWAGRRIQPHNFPRPTMDQKRIEDAIPYLGDAEFMDNFFGKPVDVIVNCLRAMLVPAPGKDFLVGDFSNVEGRVLAWLAGEEWKLKAFRDFDAGKGPDIYLLTAARMYGVPVGALTKKSPERLVGKVSELAGGFGGGVGAFRQMEKSLHVDLGFTDAELDEKKQAWRAANPNIEHYWHEVEAAAINATLNLGAFSAGPKGREVKFRKDGSFLWCRLPSGRVLCYPYPKIMSVTTPWGAQKDALTYFTVVSAVGGGKVIEDPNANGTWQRISTFGGSLVENGTQAVARDLLARALLKLEAAGFPVVMHVHDEAVCEVDENLPELALAEFCATMSTVPTWASSLPVSVDSWRGKRYAKG